MVREEVVRKLMEAANDGLLTVVDDTTSSGEVMSAYLTLARAALQEAQRLGVPSATLRGTVQQLLLDCIDVKKAN